MFNDTVGGKKNKQRDPPGIGFLNVAAPSSLGPSDPTRTQILHDASNNEGVDPPARVFHNVFDSTTRHSGPSGTETMFVGHNDKRADPHAVGVSHVFDPTKRHSGTPKMSSRTQQNASLNIGASPQAFTAIKWEPLKSNTETSINPRDSPDGTTYGRKARIGGIKNQLIEEAIAAEREAVMNKTHFPLPTNNRQPKHSTGSEITRKNPNRNPNDSTPRHQTQTKPRCVLPQLSTIAVNKSPKPPANTSEFSSNTSTALAPGERDLLVSRYTAAKTVATQATIQLQEEGSRGEPFLSCYGMKDKLGQGRFASVYQCQHTRTGSSYAVKEIDMTKFKAAEKAMLKHEIAVLKLLRGTPYIIRLFGVFREPGKTYLVLEEMKGGDLMHRICDKEVYTEREARELCKVLFHAVDYCHKKKIAHRDIKLDNLLLVEPNDDSTIKLSDFGFAKRVTKPLGLKTFCGTPSYMAPEIWDKNVKWYDYRCDMWSVGVVVYGLLGGYLPFAGTMQELAKLVPKGQIRFHKMYWKDTTEEARQMITCLLKTNPDERYTAAEALGCRWMGLDDEELGTIDLSATQEVMRSSRTKPNVKL